MGERLGEALLDLDTDDRKFNQGVDRAGRRATGLGRVFDDTSRRAARLGKAMAAAAAVGAAAFTAGIVSAVKRLEDMRKASAQVDQALKNSGNTARTSAKEIEAWADALEERTGRAAEEVMDVAANLASFGFGRDEFYRAIALADDMAAAWGGDLRQNLEGLSRALDDPINGMAMLSKRGIKLTDDQKALAAAFLDAGDKVSAQGVVFEALEAQVRGVAEAGFGGLSAAIAKAQKRWEDAFEDLVEGNGNAADLRDTLIGLADTLSSPEFIDAAMGFGSVLAASIQIAAQAVIWTWGKVKEFLAWLEARKPENRTGDALQQDLAEQEDFLRRMQEPGNGMGFFGLDAAPKDIERVSKRIAVLKAELAKRHDPTQFDVGATFDRLGGKGTFDNPEAMWTALGRRPGKPSGSDGAAGIKVQSDALKDLIADLEHERSIVGLSALDQEVMNAVRQAGVDVMSEEGLKIRALITETEEHRDQIERMQEGYELLGDIGKSSVMKLVDALEDGQVEGQELLSILGNVLSMAGQFFLNQAFGGIGGGGAGSVVSSLFSGFFADGGLIPNGSFGIVGEEGPEPVIGTPHGAQVLSNSSLAELMGGGMVNHITINGTNLSPAELAQAIRDGLDRFSRYELPGRVASINADPLARG